jgi:DNA polymerase delta subunit 3
VSEPSSAANSQASSKPSGKAAPAKQKGNLFSSFAKAKNKISDEQKKLI